VAVDTSNLTFQLHDLKEDDITRNQVYTRFAYGIRQHHLDQEVSTRFRIRDSQNVTLLHIRFGTGTTISVHLNGARNHSRSNAVGMVCF
jgi:hypothetical protein